MLFHWRLLVRTRMPVLWLCRNFTSAAPNRGDRVPDPDVDEIAAVFWSFQGPNDGRALREACQTGIIVVGNEQLHPSRLRDFLVEVVDTELELLNKIVDVVVDLDPDIITGWEVQAASWGYLNFRGQQYGQSPSLIFGVS
jgi:DNA polymerase zeta